MLRSNGLRLVGEHCFRWRWYGKQFKNLFHSLRPQYWFSSQFRSKSAVTSETCTLDKSNLWHSNEPYGISLDLQSCKGVRLDAGGQKELRATTRLCVEPTSLLWCTFTWLNSCKKGKINKQARLTRLQAWYRCNLADLLLSSVYSSMYLIVRTCWILF